MILQATIEDIFIRIIISSITSLIFAVIGSLFLIRASKSIERDIEGFQNPKFFMYIGVLQIISAIWSFITTIMYYYLFFYSRPSDSTDYYTIGITVSIFSWIGLIFYIPYLVYLFLLGRRNKEQHEGKYLLYAFIWIFVSMAITTLVSYLVSLWFTYTYSPRDPIDISTVILAFIVVSTVGFIMALIRARFYYLFATRLPDSNVKIYSFIIILASIASLIISIIYLSLSLSLYY